MSGDFDFELVERRGPPAPPPFDCAICCRTIEAHRWTMERDFPRYRPPVCESCQRHWAVATKTRPNRMTRGDHRNLLRLSALITALQWEIVNGNGRSPFRSLAIG